jgi:beta-phosphoglucomutase family hydrolase
MEFAAIFDWDGVIIDSSCAHRESWERLAEHEVRVLPQGYFERGFGLRNETIIPKILGWTDDAREIAEIAERKEALYREIISTRGIEPLPGVRGFLHMLREHGIPCAIGSSTPRLNITCALGMSKIEDTFSAIVAAEDVSRGKPDPEVFLLAARRLDVVPERCIVFEDALAGIAAARAGKMKVVAVTTTTPASRLSHADLVVERLDTLTVARITGLF